MKTKKPQGGPPEGDKKKEECHHLSQEYIGSNLNRLKGPRANIYRCRDCGAEITEYL
jgi:hypothetical protein